MAEILAFRRPTPNRVEIPDFLRDYEQCRIQQEHAYCMKRYWEIMMVDGDPKKCFVRRCEKTVSAYQIAMRNGGVLPPGFV